MRDIRSDLRERLAEFAKERNDAEQQYEKRLQEIDAREALVKQLLNMEEARAVAGTQAERKNMSLRNGAANALEHEILGLLEDGAVWGHENIRDALIARGFAAG